MTGNPQTRSFKALTTALCAFNGNAVCDEEGYADDLADNLIKGVVADQFAEDFAGGAGQELEGKIRAAYSSSALAVNCFARWRNDPSDLKLAGQTGFSRLQFEAKCPTGLSGKPPHLDLLLSGRDTVLAVESKCTEHLADHTAEFSDAYRERIIDDRRETGWFREMEELRERPKKYRFLNAAQLIKHYFGVARTYPNETVTLLYLFWEPANAEDVSLFADHRREIEVFSEAVSGSPVSFVSQSYPELWNEWRGSPEPVWLEEHLENLKARYLVEI